MISLDQQYPSHRRIDRVKLAASRSGAPKPPRTAQCAEMTPVASLTNETVAASGLFAP